MKTLRKIILLSICSLSLSLSSPADAGALQNCKRTLAAIMSKSAEISAKSMFAPLMFLFTTLRHKSSGDSPKEAFGKSFKEYRKYLALYGLIFAGLNSFDSHFYTIDFKKFDEVSEKVMAPDPDRVLYLISYSSPDNAGSFISNKFLKSTKANPKNIFISFQSTEDLVEKLKSLPATAKFDRIETSMHGDFNKLKTADHNFLDLKVLQKANLKFGGSHLDIRVISCSVSCGSPFNEKDQSFQKELARAFSDGEVRVITATRDIDTIPEIPQLNLIRKTALGAAFVMGMGNFVYTWSNIPNTWRNYSESFNDIKVVDVQGK
ncbi:MAG: hypothetical protein JWQ35_2788 [Bacteriovoracaceae bacterium]|nr:hypothetical protein [Bacteriovoracaceae bacterium]